MQLCNPPTTSDGSLRLKVFRGLGIDLVEDGSGRYGKAVVRMTL